MLKINKTTIHDLESDANFQNLLEEYSCELEIEGLPHPSAKIDMYKQLESIGSLYPIAAYFNNVLIGLINVLMVMNPHYGVSIAVSESFFVMKEYRKTGAGMKLRSFAERVAQEMNSPGFFMSSPSWGPLVDVLPRVGYEETGRTFFKRFENA